MLTTIAALSHLLRSALLAGCVALLGVAALDWAVRTRRISPFSGVSRFMRGRVEPRLAGVERLVVRAGGHPSTTPWWAVLAYVMFALLVLAVAGFLLDTARELAFALAGGVAGILVLVVEWTFGILMIGLMVRVVASWVPRLAASRWIRWSYGATEWMLRPLRRALPSFGPVDISPLVAYFALQFVRFLVLGALVHLLP